MTKLPTGIWKRGSKLAFAASKIALTEVSSRLKSWETEKEKLESQLATTRALVKTLSELKGASMKLGQLLSLDFGDFLPPEIIKVLEGLHQDAVSLSYKDIEKILKQELGNKFDELSDISQKPIASASIGQVHTAWLGDKKVVLKVQYPNVAKTIPQDVKILSTLLTQLARIQNKQIDFSPLLQEVSEVMRLEADYLNELKMLQQYRENFKDSRFVIPDGYADFSTDKVLCLDFVEGQKLTDWLQTADSDLKEKVADDLLMLYLKEFFQHGLVQTDPNPGNFFITPENKIALLDFGAVKFYKAEFISGYTKVIKAALAENREQVLQHSYEMGFIDPRENDETKNTYCDLINLVANHFRTYDIFDFKDKSFITESQKLAWQLSKKSQFSPPPKELIFLHRKLGGIFVLIRKLGVSMVLKDYWDRALESPDKL